MSFRDWLSGLLNRPQARPEDPVMTRLYYVGKSAAGVRVTQDTSLQNATVWACVQYLTKAVGQLPWNALLETPSGGAEPAKSRDGQALNYLLNTRPNPDMGSFTWRSSMLGTALLWGNAYAEIEWTARGTPYALWPIHPERVGVRRNRETGLLEYEVWNSAGNAVIAAADMYHIRGFGDGPVGYNVIEYAAQSIGWAQATEIFGSSYFSQGMNPSGIIEMPQSLSLEAKQFLHADLDKLYAGPKGKRTAILDAGMKFSKITSTPDEAQFVDTRQHQVEEICRWFGVPPHKVMHLLRATFANIEHQSIEVVVDSVTPWVKIFEEEADYKLCGNRSGLFTKMNLRGLLRGDAASRASFYKTMFELGMSINQILALEDFNGIGPDGDERFVSNNVQTLKRAIAGPPQPVAPQPNSNDDDEPAVPAKPNGAANGRRLQH